jgi:hypothetical protein
MSNPLAKIGVRALEPGELIAVVVVVLPVLAACTIRF